MPRITLVGAGSTVFAKNIISDCLSFPELAESTFVLYDIDPERLKTSELMAQHLVKAWKAGAKIVATTDPREAFEGADYAVNMIQVGGYEPCTVIDFEVPKKYGIRQTIGDTLGDRGDFPGAAYHPGHAGIRADNGRAVPGCVVLELREPAGDDYLGDAGGDEHQDRGALS